MKIKARLEAQEIFPIEFLRGLLKVGKHLHLQAIAASASQERLLKINLTLRSLSLEQPSYSPPLPISPPRPDWEQPRKVFVVATVVPGRSSFYLPKTKANL
ncbi:hypothetical protein CEXT_632971 [Caerostris extrusa]|uniref:Uncharacterized protein n=1 Tax=Caerostris extrusa TaxID=172846 RepID=A0AAV4MXL7_CAEEX|nr:hypothetical protein CEXT_632971 [Caerostris extrusa]